jgi:hypothetical protein
MKEIERSLKTPILLDAVGSLSLIQWNSDSLADRCASSTLNPFPDFRIDHQRYIGGDRRRRSKGFPYDCSLHSLSPSELSWRWLISYRITGAVNRNLVFLVEKLHIRAVIHWGLA